MPVPKLTSFVGTLFRSFDWWLSWSRSAADIPVIQSCRLPGFQLVPTFSFRSFPRYCRNFSESRGSSLPRPSASLLTCCQLLVPIIPPPKSMPWPSRHQSQCCLHGFPRLCKISSYFTYRPSNCGSFSSISTVEFRCMSATSPRVQGYKGCIPKTVAAPTTDISYRWRTFYCVKSITVIDDFGVWFSDRISGDHGVSKMWADFRKWNVRER